MTRVEDQNGRPLVLVLDDEADFCDLARTYLEIGGCRVVTATDPDAAKALMTEVEPDAIISDLLLGENNGLAFYRQVLEAFPSGFPFFFLTGCEGQHLHHALDAAPDRAFRKPCDWGDLVSTVKNAVERRREQPAL